MTSEADLQVQVADYLRCSSKSFDSLSDAVELRAKMEEKYARA